MVQQRVQDDPQGQVHVGLAQPLRPQGAPNTCSCLRSLVLGSRRELQLQSFRGRHSSKVSLALKASSSPGDRDWNLLMWQPLLEVVGWETGLALVKPSTTVTSTRTQAQPRPKLSCFPGHMALLAKLPALSQQTCV